MIQPKEHGNVLEIGCKMGCTLARIESKYPKIQVIGIENNEKFAVLAKQVTNMQDNMVTFLEGTFDYIILDGTIIAWGSPVLLLQKAERLLKATGEIIISVRNANCIKKFPNNREEPYVLLEEMATIFEQVGLEKIYRSGRTRIFILLLIKHKKQPI
ncbi:class I SAM-dependent methyltransferase [Lachnospiraceae bacterium ZAX-1]